VGRRPTPRRQVVPACTPARSPGAPTHTTTDLWYAVARGAELLRFWWAAPQVATWRRKLDEIILRLKDLAPGNVRSTLVFEWSSLSSEEMVRELVRATTYHRFR
jgi:hypothetical protein